MHGGRDVVVPEVSDGSLAADLAGDHLGPHERVATDYASLVLNATVRTDQASLVDLVAALLAVTSAERLVHVGIHIHVKNPVSDVVALVHGDQVLLRQWDVVGRGDVSLLEV